MKAIEFETSIDENGQILVPQEYQETYGKNVRLVVLLSDEFTPPAKRRAPGSAKGVLSVVAEDEEHLEDFRDYVP